MSATSEQFLLDTHVWLWLIDGSPKLSQSSMLELNKFQRAGVLFGSVISVWEIALLESLRRVVLQTTIEEWLQTSFEDDGIQLQEISVAAAVEANRLPGAFHRDPVDRILVATARQMDFTLLTRDDVLLAYAKAGHLRARRV